MLFFVFLFCTGAYNSSRANNQILWGQGSVQALCRSALRLCVDSADTGQVRTASALALYLGRWQKEAPTLMAPELVLWLAQYPEVLLDLFLG